MVTLNNNPPGVTLDNRIATEVMGVSEPKEYSTKKEFALEVLDHLQRYQKTISLRWWPEAEAPGFKEGLWTCHVGTGSYSVAGKSMEHAICLAALAFEEKV